MYPSMRRLDFSPLLAALLAAPIYGSAGVNDTCPTIASNKKFGKVYKSKVENAVTLEQADVCQAAGCRSTFEQSMMESYLATKGVAMEPASYAADAMSCFCDGGGNEMNLSTTGMTFWETAAAVKTACASSTCRDKVMNSDIANAGEAISLYCSIGYLRNCEPGSANFADAKNALTTCMCDAASAGFHYKYFRDSADRNGGLPAVDASYMTLLIGVGWTGLTLLILLQFLLCRRGVLVRDEKGIVIADTRERDGTAGNYCAVPSASAYFDILFGLGFPGFLLITFLLILMCVPLPMFFWLRAEGFQRDPAWGVPGEPFCAVPSCSAYLDMLIGMGWKGYSCSESGRALLLLIAAGCSSLLASGHLLTCILLTCILLTCILLSTGARQRWCLQSSPTLLCVRGLAGPTPPIGSIMGAAVGATVLMSGIIFTCIMMQRKKKQTAKASPEETAVA